MIYLHTFLYYTIFSSVVLVYGVGINRIAEFGISQKEDIFFFIKIVLSVLCTSLITWVIIARILVPLKLIELYPVVAFIIFTAVNSLLEGIVRIISGKSSNEFLISFLIILISLTESTSVLNTLLICISAIVSIAITYPMCLTLKARVMDNGHKVNEKYYSLFFIFLAVLIVIMSVWDIIWINSGVIQ